MIGDLIDTGQGTVTIHIVRNLDHPVDKVWRAITEQQHLESWFPQRVIGELTTPGAALRFEHTEFDAATFDGKVLACEPPRLLEFLWGVDVIRLEVAPHGTGCTLTLSDTIEEKGKAAVTAPAGTRASRSSRRHSTDANRASARSSCGSRCIPTTWPDSALRPRPSGRPTTRVTESSAPCACPRGPRHARAG